jgi:hypothetical protein
MKREDRTARKVEEFSLDVSGLSRAIRDGDLVTVHTLVPRFDRSGPAKLNSAISGNSGYKAGPRSVWR